MNYFLDESSNRKFSHELHALRGVAALLVFFVHLQNRAMTAFPDVTIPYLFNGSAAVTFFFVLSGFVVGMSVGRIWGKKLFLAEYAVRRIFRIMPLMIVMTTLGGIYVYFINPYMKIPIYEESYGEFSPIKWVAGYIGYSMKANPPSWSIFVELVGSVLLPFFILAGRNKATIIAAGLVLAGLATIDTIDTQHRWHFYMISFYAGLSVLYWGKSFAQRISRLGPLWFWALVGILALGFYLPRPIIGTDMYGNPWMPLWETATVTPLVALIYYVPEYFTLLKGKIFRFFGDISFSLYLTHYIFILMMYNAFIMIAGVSLTVVALYLAIIIPLSFLLAYLSYTYLEQPCIGLGKKAMKYVEISLSKKEKQNV